MMTNLFNIFDPSSSMNLSINWFSMIILLIYLPFQFWLIPSRSMMIWIKITNYLMNEFKILINYSYSNLILFISMFMLIFFNNFLSLNPYIFTSPSHLSMTLSLSLSIWMSIMIFSISNYFNTLMIHLTPQGTPSILMPFMVIIELISLMIRPLTLAIRLTANMIAGHLLLSLLGSTGITINNLIILTMMLFTQLMLLMLEISVSLIQAYVFTILSTLYSSEI